MAETIISTSGADLTAVMQSDANAGCRLPSSSSDLVQGPWQRTLSFEGSEVSFRGCKEGGVLAAAFLIRFVVVDLVYFAERFDDFVISDRILIIS